MSESTAFKNYFNADMVRQLAGPIHEVYTAFKLEAFSKQATKGLNALELKDRSRKIAAALKDHLPGDYARAIDILIESLGPPLGEQAENLNDGFFYWPYADFVELYGLGHPEESMRANYEITRRFTAEFSIRPFIQEHPDYVMGLLEKWIHDADPHVRRLVSEGTRPRLPWGKQLKGFIDQPETCLPLLEQLKDDPSLYVRRSVANHLNDIGKDHPALVVKICRRWSKEKSPEVDWVIKHALRNHLKQGDPEALRLLGYGPVKVTAELSIEPRAIQVGEFVYLNLRLQSNDKGTKSLMVDYRVHFVRKGGKTGIKVFKWKTLGLQPGETIALKKKHSFKPVTTRVYYPGMHTIDVQVNGVVVAEADFELL